MRPVDNPNITLASADCWRFTVRSDLQNKTYYIYAETKEGGMKYLSQETHADYLGNTGVERIVYTRPPEKKCEKVVIGTQWMTGEQVWDCPIYQHRIHRTCPDCHGYVGEKE